MTPLGVISKRIRDKAEILKIAHYYATESMLVWDHKKKLLSLARDRMGEKPLYFGWINKNFTFASELKAFHAFPEFTNQIDENALNLF